MRHRSRDSPCCCIFELAWTDHFGIDVTSPGTRRRRLDRSRLLPPAGFVATTVDFAIVPTQSADCELVANLTSESGDSGAQVMRIGGTPTT